ncbi:GNAT family N-acetyltransferase [Kordiimonas sp. SCSIO 12610]|nr:GNAT family N-acetyltransferase [Kordiimonas sp. SCSIO 12610]UTW55853.1 GNAT family N-acetyltransferase [Kordiimonas sp. SCSIO 12610]
MTNMQIVLDDLSHPDVQALLKDHMKGMQENSPIDSVFALDISGLKTKEISFWTAWENETILGCGALKELSPTHGEIKSMRTHKTQLRKGVAARLLEHIIDTAKIREYKILSLETGSGPAFDPAIRLYKKYGFKNGAAFSDYQASEFNQFLHLKLK